MRRLKEAFLLYGRGLLKEEQSAEWVSGLKILDLCIEDKEELKFDLKHLIHTRWMSAVRAKWESSALTAEGLKDSTLISGKK